MSSITLNRIIDQCAEGVLISTGKKNPRTQEAANRIFDLAWRAYKSGSKIEPIGSGFIVSKGVKSNIRDCKAELDRSLPLCRRIAILAERECDRKELDKYSRIIIGFSGVALFIPIREEESVLTSRPAILAMVEVIGAYAIQAFKHWRLPNREPEKAELTRLWMELDGEIPANIGKASEEMRVQLTYAKAMVNYASVRLRVNP
jgi:hypothetical protein